ncbi:DUF4126 domain-containing protein [Brevundimonas sp. 2R-24]|uniref:DUF4126 domain-containing protein n=1 Tax=Peiella sedimenti TaxID=3061083 RepID=A0ABT8SMS8_9CAUL|nr:DUF4126 domain-containing protein [Caulobacteraceae bacterium XZ-24]
MPEFDWPQWMQFMDWTAAANQAGEAAGPLQVWILPILLGLGLASATGFRTFLPMLLLGVAARFELFGIRLNEQAEWLVSDIALFGLGAAAVLEFAADKIPVLDHGLNAVGLVARPIAAAIAVGGVFWALDPGAAALAGVIVGAPTALAFAGVQGGARMASSGASAGLANPLVSVLEDVLTVMVVLLAFLAPVLIPVVLIALAVVVFRISRALRRRARRKREEAGRSAPAGSAA